VTVAAPLELKVRTAREVCEEPDPPDSDELLGPLIRRGQRTIPVGDTGEGKTTLVMQAIRAAVEGGELLGWRGTGDIRALVVDLEQGRRTVKRVLLEAGLKDSEAVDYVLVPDGLTLDSNDQHAAELERVIAAGGYAIVALDPYYKAHRGDSNDERAVVDLMRRLDGLRDRYGFGLILPAHPRKDSPGSTGPRRLTLSDVAGSGGLTRGAEIVVAIEKLAPGHARLRFLKDRDGDLPVGTVWNLLFTRGGGFRRDPKDSEPPRDIAAELLELGSDGEWRTLNEWRSARDEGGIGANDKTVKAALDNLVEEGVFEFEVGPAGRSRNARCWRSVTDSGPLSNPESVESLRNETGATDSLTQPLFREAVKAESVADAVTRPSQSTAVDARAREAAR